MGMKQSQGGAPAFEELLSRYFDGELSPDEAGRVEARLLEDPASQQLLEQLGQTRTCLRETYHAEVARVDFDDFWRGIEAGIERQAKPLRERAGVAQPSWWERLREWVGSLGAHQLGYGLAMAAVALLAVGVSYLSNQHVEVAYHIPHMVPPGVMDIDPVTGNIPPLPDSVPQVGTPDEVAALVPPEVITDGVEVAELSGDNASSLMILDFPDHATIIWVDDDDGQETSI